MRARKNKASQPRRDLRTPEAQKALERLYQALPADQKAVIDRHREEDKQRREALAHAQKQAQKISGIADLPLAEAIAHLEASPPSALAVLYLALGPTLLEEKLEQEANKRRSNGGKSRGEDRTIEVQEKHKEIREVAESLKQAGWAKHEIASLVAKRVGRSTTTVRKVLLKAAATSVPLKKTKSS